MDYWEKLIFARIWWSKSWLIWSLLSCRNWNTELQSNVSKIWPHIHSVHWCIYCVLQFCIINLLFPFFQEFPIAHFIFNICFHPRWVSDIKSHSFIWSKIWVSIHYSLIKNIYLLITGQSFDLVLSCLTWLISLSGLNRKSSNLLHDWLGESKITKI